MPDLPRRRRTQGPMWMRRISGRLTATIKALVLINLCVYLFYVFARDWRPFFESHLALGPGRTSVLFFTAGVLSNLVIAGVWGLRGFGPVPFVDGCSFSVMALFVAFARMYGRQPVQFWPTTLMVQARYMVLGLAGIAALVTIAQGNWPWLAGLFVAIAVGFFGGAPGGWSTLR